MSEATGEREIVSVSTVQLRDGSLLYLIGVAPRDENDALRAGVPPRAADDADSRADDAIASRSSR